MMKVLLVDDEAAILEQTDLFLKKEIPLIEVERAGSVEDALSFIMKGDIDCIVSDYMMPDKNGLDLLKIIRREDFQTPFIIFTGKGREDVAIEALNLGADRYIQKGGDPRSQFYVLAQAIRQEVKHRHTSEELERKKDMYRMIAENPYDMITLVDLNDDKIIFISHAVQKLLGYEPDEIIKKPFFQMIHPEDEDGIKEMIKAKHRQGYTEGTFHDRVLSKGGGYKWIENRFRLIMDEEDDPHMLLIVSRDATEKKKERERVRKVMNDYKAIFENSWTALLLIEEDKTVSLVNEKFEKLSGYSREEIEGKKKWTDFVHEDDLKRMICYHEKRRDNSEKVLKEYEARLIHKDGEVVWFRMNVDMIPGTDKSVCSMLDVTEKRHLKDVHDGLMESRHFGFLIVQNGKIVKFNRGIELMSGYSPTELEEKNPLDFIPEEEEKNIELLVKDMLSGKRTEPFEHEYIKKNGGTGYVMEQIIPIEYRGRKAAMIILIDVTNFKQIGTALAKSEKEYEMILENTKDIIYSVDGEGDIQYISNAVRGYGFDPDDLMGKNIIDFVHPEDKEKVAEKFRTTIDKNIDFPIEARVIDAHGDIVHIEEYGKPIVDEGKVVGMTGVIRDVSDRKKVEERVDMLHSLLRHDVRNKTQVTLGYLQLIEDIDLPKKADDYISKMKTNIEKNIDLIEKVRALRRAEEEELRGMDIDRCVKEVVQQSRSMIDRDEIEIDISDVERCTVRANTLLDQLFFNLVENALNHSHGSLVKISVDCKEDVTVIIEDNGVGISDDKKDIIFEKGYTTDNDRGTGLGLFLVKNLISIYGGDIRVSDSEFGGAKFIVKLQRYDRSKPL
ncbi:MAG: PAS domain S-box protein [Thermoplasmata archaeon]